MGYTIVPMPRRMACGSRGDYKVTISPVLESRPASLTHTQGDLCSTMCRLEVCANWTFSNITAPLEEDAHCKRTSIPSRV